MIIGFLFARNIYKNYTDNEGNFSSDSNVLSINIADNTKKNIDETITELKKNFKYLKLKSVNIEKNSSNYVFWYESENSNLKDLLKNISELSDDNVSISIYSKSGAFE